MKTVTPLKCQWCGNEWEEMDLPKETTIIYCPECKQLNGVEKSKELRKESWL